MKRNKFNLSHYRLMSAKMGQAFPVGCIEVLPGDSFRHAIESIVRMAPLVHPVLHPTHLCFRVFYDRSRNLQANFADHFITGGKDGEGDGSSWPYITVPNGGFAIGSLADCLGIPTGQGDGQKVDAKPFRSYGRIINEYFHDRVIQADRVVSYGDGNDTTTDLSLANCLWEKDYFTTQRLEPQLGPEILLPIAGTAPVIRDVAATTATLVRNAATGALATGLSALGTTASGQVQNSGTPLEFDPNGTMLADLSLATGIPINDLYKAIADQDFANARSRHGWTYKDYLQYLGLPSSDGRLDLPEYLGGFSTTVQFSEVLSTNGATGGNLGALGGHGIAAGNSARYTRYFEEHGYVTVIAYCRPKTVYMNGLNRMWSRDTKELYWQLEHEHEGQQEVKYKEVFFDHSTPEETRGYQDVYDEYRRQESYVSGEFRDTLKTWNLARIIDSDAEAELDSAFITCNPRTDIFAAPSADNMYLLVRHDLKSRRVLSKQGTTFSLNGTMR